MSTGVGNAVLRKLNANAGKPLSTPVQTIEAEARDIALVVERHWGDQSAEVLAKAAEIAAERSKR